MVGMQNLVPRWLHQEYDMNDDRIDPPTIATLERPPAFNEQDADALAVQQSALVFSKLKRQIESSQVEITELVLTIEGLQQKVNFLEKDSADKALQIIELQNNLQNLETQRDADLQFLSIVRRYLDARDIKAAPKKPRNGKNGEHNGEKKTAPATKATEAIEETAPKMDQQTTAPKA